jgi:outer membrane lipoprotein SlyB
VNALWKPGSTRINPLIAAAAVSVAVLGLAGIGAMTGMFPGTRSTLPEARSSQRGDIPATNQNAAEGPARATRCAICGTVESIRTVELRGGATGVDPATGEPTGAVIGNQMGSDNTVMTIIGAAAGVFAGNDADANKRHAYRVTVRMDDGSFRAVSLPGPPAFAVGEKVRVIEGKLVRA